MPVADLKRSGQVNTRAVYGIAILANVLTISLLGIGYFSSSGKTKAAPVAVVKPLRAVPPVLVPAATATEPAVTGAPKRVATVAVPTPAPAPAPEPARVPAPVPVVVAEPEATAPASVTQASPAAPSTGLCIDFEDVPQGTNSFKGSYTTSGFVFTGAKGNAILNIESPAHTTHARRTKCLGAGSMGVLTVTRADGLPFLMYAMDVSTFIGRSAVITGNRVSGPVTRVVNLPGAGVRYATIILDWADVRSVSIAWSDDFEGKGEPRPGEIDNLFLNSRSVLRVANPVPSKPAGEYSTEGISIQLSCTTPKAEIYCTTNGVLPNTRYDRYEGDAITVSKSMRLRAWARCPGMIDSDCVTYDYWLGKGVAPTITTQPRTIAGEGPERMAIKVSGNPPPEIQWQRKAAGEARFVDIPGANVEHLPPALKGSPGDTYRAVVSNPLGQVISEPATIGEK